MAAVMVAVYHLTYVEWADPHARGTDMAATFLAFRSWAPFVDTGWVGVQIFFVISGFVIAYTADGRSPASFLKSRILRLMPGIWICSTVSVVALLATGTGGAQAAYLYAMSMVLAPFGPWVASSYWTLPVEIMFYAIVYVLLYRGRFDRIEAAMTVLGGVSLLVCMTVEYTQAMPGAIADHAGAILSHRYLKPLLLQHGCFFALGTTIWIVGRRGPTVRRVSTIAAFIAAGVMQIDAETRRAAAWAGLSMSALLPIVAFLASLLFIAASLRWNGAVHEWLGDRRRIVRTLGLMTFPLYLLHQPIGVPLCAWALGIGLPPVLAVSIAIAVVMAVAWIVAVRLEPPLRAWLLPRLEELGATRRPIGRVPPSG